MSWYSAMAEQRRKEGEPHGKESSHHSSRTLWNHRRAKQGHRHDRESGAGNSLSGSPHRTPCFYRCPQSLFSTRQPNWAFKVKSCHVPNPTTLLATHRAHQPLSFLRSLCLRCFFPRYALSPLLQICSIIAQWGLSLPPSLKLQQSQPPLPCATFSTAHILLWIIILVTIILICSKISKTMKALVVACNLI